ncbi:hypothetical protein SAMN05216483_6230 [Streptomyces sp. 2131.1]|nr:hypothetical protein SAMN05216483_6230 [Streptomyces sp. 2131.1]
MEDVPEAVAAVEAEVGLPVQVGLVRGAGLSYAVKLVNTPPDVPWGLVDMRNLSQSVRGWRSLKARHAVVRWAAWRRRIGAGTAGAGVGGVAARRGRALRRWCG